MGPETPEGDAAEQARQPVEGVEDEEFAVPFFREDVDPADLADQLRQVPVDEPDDRG